MTNYRYVKSAIINRHDILESKTGYIVKENLSHDEAKELARKLNFGMGFDGWTPEFILKQIPLPSMA
jgi:hypothetical protein